MNDNLIFATVVLNLIIAIINVVAIIIKTAGSDNKEKDANQKD